MRLALTGLLLGIGLSAQADELVLRSGRRLSGEIVQRTESTVTIEMAPGRVTIPLAAVERMTVGPSALSVFRERAERLAPDDVAGWLALAIWARDAGLATQATWAFERVIAIDPENAQAQAALGRVRVGDRWLSGEDAHRAQGLVLFEGDWITPQERDNRITEHEAEARQANAGVETETRRAEAEARVRQAEAEARRSEAEAAAAERATDQTIPWWLLDGRDRPRGHRRHHERHAEAEPARPSQPLQTRPTPERPAPTPPAPPSAGAASAGSRSGRR